MKKIATAIIISFVLSSNVFAQTFNATSNRPEVASGEIFVTTFTYTGDDINQTPDFSKLSENFDILGTSTEISTKTINGYISKSKSWSISMSSNQEKGEINIPEISLGKLKSNPIILKINNENKKEKIVNDIKYKIEISNDKKEPYIGEQIDYKISITEYDNINYSNIYISPDSEKDWEIIQYKNTDKSQNEDGNLQTNFYFKIFPKKSGDLEIPKITITAYKTTPHEYSNSPRKRMSFFGNDVLENMLNFGNNVIEKNISTPQKTINIKPQPNNISWWLPAKKVKIVSAWDKSLTDLKAGEPVKRTIIVAAEEVIKHQLPDISLENFNDIKIYPEKPILSSFVENDTIISSAQLNAVYIKENGGEINIPEEKIYWYNTQNQNFEEAILPSETLYFSGKKQTSKEEIILKNQPSDISNDNDEPSNKYILFMLFAFIAGIIITFIAMKTIKKEPKKETNSFNQNTNIISIAKNKDLKKLQEALIIWGSNKFKNNSILSLEDIKKNITNNDFRNEIDKINQAIYSKKEINWDENNFINLFKKIDKEKASSKKEKEILPKLYK